VQGDLSHTAVYPDRVSIHSLIKARRKALKMSEQTLAEAIGVTRGAVQQWEREYGTAPKRSIRPKVAEVLGLSVHDLTAAESDTPIPGVAQKTSSRLRIVKRPQPRG
jgi:transcriptional regulator with XRE-family HTH domain